MTRVMHNILWVLAALLYLPVLFLWEIPFRHGVLVLLNERGALRFDELIALMGYAIPPDGKKIGWAARKKYEWILAALIAEVEAPEARIHAVYDAGHRRCGHARFNITVRGQKALKL